MDVQLRALAELEKEVRETNFVHYFAFYDTRPTAVDVAKSFISTETPYLFTPLTPGVRFIMRASRLDTRIPRCEIGDLNPLCGGNRDSEHVSWSGVYLCDACMESYVDFAGEQSEQL